MSVILETLEARLSGILEGTLDRLLFPGAGNLLSAQLAQMITGKMRSQIDNKDQVPDLIILWVSPDRWDGWQAADPLLKQVMNTVESELSGEGYHFRLAPQIRLFQDPTLELNEIRIEADYSKPDLLTANTRVNTISIKDSAVHLPSGAYLIINGKTQVCLDKPVINIGRRSSNDIVINDPTVSRKHLQLRGEQGHYLCFDLSSSGGTRINNQSASSATLRPGDVIQIGQTTLIYNQDPTALTGGTELIGHILPDKQND